MTRFKRLLLPTDFSARSAHAATFARSLAEQNQATLYVLHVGQRGFAVSPSPDTINPVVLPALDEDELRRRLDRFVDTALRGLDTPVVTDVRLGAPVQVIAQYAREKAIDLIIIGTDARGLFSRILAGSISKAVLERAGCAVLMVPTAAPAPEEVAASVGAVTAGQQRRAL